MTFPRADCTLRTDYSFRQQIQREHHITKSPIEELPVDMVADFPTSDPLHLLELGIMKKCLLRWTFGSPNYAYRFTNNDTIIMNRILEHANADMPTEIHRAIRSLKYLRNWKGTEFRTFLLYVGILALEGNIRKEEYDHFLTLFCATTLCSTDHFSKYVVNDEMNALSLADNLFLDYFEKYIDHYGIGSITSNIHNLCHITDDVRRFGHLNSISTYPYENALRIMKLKIKKCNRPLEQISRRILELEDILEKQMPPKDLQSRELPTFKYPITIGRNDYQTVIFDCFRLSSRKSGDKWILFRSSASRHVRILEMTKVTKNITDLGIKAMIYGKPIIGIDDFFLSPFKSSHINVFISNGKQGDEICIDSNEIVCKLVCMSHKRGLVFVPLLHTYR